ncbi:MAG: iron ABC transporter permease [Bifidobacterium crudilactis]|jgi:iron complex transport system permease protein|uniref:FecCD family ABC transporter permease n=1 Tax=Bifidobacterium crudilactis TaxID=327277 RepID=UPI002352207B|nr:iron ABC transporter permease [Bifidobacterium crudilactis]MCI1217919.1 iron ABC transporter permease [Bifidobacterium crudilactis]
MTTDTATAERHATGHVDESAATTANSLASHDDNINRTPNKNWSILPRVLLLIIGLVILAAEILVSVRLGSASLSMEDVWDAVVSGVFQLPVEETFRKTFTVIFALRFPRVLLAVLAGAALATSGVVMQALLRNPLVSPFTLGVSPAAAFGAALTILVLSQRGISAPSQLVALGALVSALAVSALVLGLSKTRASSTATLLLLGIAMTQLFEALTSAVQFVADENTLQQIVRWTFGSVNEATWSDVRFLAVVLIVALPCVVWYSPTLNAIAFTGDDGAKSLGINVDLVRTVFIVLSVALAAAVVSVCGIIGFVGLVGPHIARLVVGSDHRFLVPFAAVSGAALLLFADTVGRTLLSPSVIPVGIVVSIIGAPVFVNLIIMRRKALA